jgi:hypothetical protein
MGYSPVKLKPESGANRIKSADDAYSFMAHMRLSYQNWPIGRRRGRRSTSLHVRRERNSRVAILSGGGSSGRLA